MPNSGRVDSNAVGERGEAIFEVRIMALHGAKPLFRPTSLGDKWPVADYAVELNGQPGRFFLVQVKATQKPVNPARNATTPRMRIDVKVDRLRLLLQSPIPAYLVAVHEPSEEAFLVAPREARHLRDVTTAFSLKDQRIRLGLHKEVASFWAGVTAPFSCAKSIFAD